MINNPDVRDEFDELLLLLASFGSCAFEVKSGVPRICYVKDCFDKGHSKTLFSWLYNHSLEYVQTSAGLRIEAKGLPEVME
jgi:hypothetical protein